MRDEELPNRVAAAALHGKSLRYYDYVMAAFVAILLLSNVLGAGKVAQVWLPGIGYWPFGAGILFFPVGYVIGDVLTEVYGYAHARRCIWVGFAALLFMAFMSWAVVAMPPAAGLAANAPPDLDSVPNNHLAYAGQWFFFAAIAAIVYVLAVRRRER